MSNETNTKRHVVVNLSDEGLSHSTTCSYVSPMVADTIKAPKIEAINERELTSINALLSYVSYNQNVREETVKMVVEAKFGVDGVEHLRRDDYMRAIEFLVDLKMDEVMN